MIAATPKANLREKVQEYRIVCYNLCVAHRYPQQGGGVHMEVFASFLIAVAAGVACHYIIKWLDGDDKSNK